jgi:hypothetical protein
MSYDIAGLQAHAYTLQKITPLISMTTFQQFLYVSRLSANYPLTEIVRAISSSRRNNSRNNITGVLYFDGELFCQYLEGESPAVQSLLTKILADDRHHDIRTLVDRNVSSRLFRSWHLGFAYNDTTGILRALSELSGDAALAELMRIKTLPDFELL